MAIATIRTDDLDGSTDDVTLVKFAVKGVEYEIDLSESNRAKFDEQLAPYVDAARLGGTVGKKTRRMGSVEPRDTAAIRAWAIGQGIPVSPRGRVRQDVIDAYDEAARNA